MLSVPREHPRARRKSVLLAGEKSFRLAVLRGDGAYVRRLKPFLERIARERGVEIFDDGFVFLQQPDLEKIPALTTRLVRRYRSEGTDRVFVPLEDEGVSAEYRISYLRGNRRAVAPFWRGRGKRGSFFPETEPPPRERAAVPAREKKNSC